jgi:hypothetical protein
MDSGHDELEAVPVFCKTHCTIAPYSMGIPRISKRFFAAATLFPPPPAPAVSPLTASPEPASLVEYCNSWAKIAGQDTPRRKPNASILKTVDLTASFMCSPLSGLARL